MCTMPLVRRVGGFVFLILSQISAAGGAGSLYTLAALSVLCRQWARRAFIQPWPLCLVGRTRNGETP